jgi:hypothetical protein
MSFVSSSYVWVIIALSAFIGLFIIFTIIRFLRFDCCARSAIFTERNLKNYQSKTKEAKVESDENNLERIYARDGKKISVDVDCCSANASGLRRGDAAELESRRINEILSGGEKGRVMNEVNRLEEAKKLNSRFSVKKSVSFSDDGGWNAFGGWTSCQFMKSQFQKSEKNSEEQRDEPWKEEGEMKSGNESDFQYKAAEDINKDLETSFFGLSNYWNSPLTRSATADSAEESDLEGNFRDVCCEVTEHEMVQDGLKKKLEQLLDQVQVVQQYRLE